MATKPKKSAVEKPEAVVAPAVTTPSSVTSYKGFDADWKCRDMQYAVGETFEHATASGNSGAATASGYSGAATASGNYGAATASGNKGTACAPGRSGKAKGKDGCALFLTYRDSDRNIKHAKALIVGQDGIKPDVWYALDANGSAVEAA